MATQKLLPPTIESKLPAQKGNVLLIPFLHNRSVGDNQYYGFKLKIKTISTNQDVVILDSEGKEAKFLLTQNCLTVGQHYKAQLAYYHKDESEKDIIGYYSTLGVFKYTSIPILSIKNSNGNKLNPAEKNFISPLIYGHYTNEKDPTEKVYSYCFNVYKDDELFASSGELLHDSSNDSIYESIDPYNFDYKLNPLSTYKIEYNIITSNNLQVNSSMYYIDNGTEVPNELLKEVKAIVDNDNGGVKIQLSCEGDIQGRFRLLRFSGEKREVIKEFVINDIANGYYDLGTDYTVEQGNAYVYGVQQYNDSFMTELIESNPVYVDFEDVFLFDGERQLKIKFNPKISSFKDTILESKLDTIGGRYPFVFRNGRTKYKEFPISGLISYWMDNDKLFMAAPTDFTTNLIGDNIATERQFKLEVLEWLNNGKPKLFRSPTEGNYIVRLMNVSLSPEDTLGRMLHTFNCTAYEIAEYNYQNLKDYNFIGQQVNYDGLWRFFVEDTSELEANDNILINSAIWMRIYDNPGTKYEINFQDGTKLDIRIGYTGMYELSNLNSPIIALNLKSKSNGINYPCKIEYASIEANIDSIQYNGEEVSNITTYEYGASFQFTGNRDVVAYLTRDENNEKSFVLDNILYLSLEYIGSEGGSREIEFNYPDGTSTKLTLGTNVIIDSNGIEHPLISGRLEFTAADFGGKFILKSPLYVNNDVRVDVYYRVKKIEVKS